MSVASLLSVAEVFVTESGMRASLVLSRYIGRVRRHPPRASFVNLIMGLGKARFLPSRHESGETCNAFHEQDISESK